MGKNLCDECDLCCRHIAVEIDKPETKKEYDQIKWFLLHKEVWVFIDNDNSWNLQVNNKCEKLGQDGFCTYYKKRPAICRDYSADSCEKNGDGKSFKILWKSLQEFEDWISGGSVIPKN